jgi:ribonuclease HII
MSGRRSLFQFDRPFRERLGIIAGVDEAGRGPLAGPVVAAAVILPAEVRIPDLNDSKALPPEKRRKIYRIIQRKALAIGVGVVDHVQIDAINIYQASLLAMRLALSQLIMQPDHILVDGPYTLVPEPSAIYQVDGLLIPKVPESQTAVIGGDGKSASIAAASIIAKVTRDAMMEALDSRFPGYGFKQHKGYCTPRHLSALSVLGPCHIHRRSFAPVRDTLIKTGYRALQNQTNVEFGVRGSEEGIFL